MDSMSAEAVLARVAGRREIQQEQAILNTPNAAALADEHTSRGQGRRCGGCDKPLRKNNQGTECKRCRKGGAVTTRTVVDGVHNDRYRELRKRFDAVINGFGYSADEVLADFMEKWLEDAALKISIAPEALVRVMKTDPDFD